MSALLGVLLLVIAWNTRGDKHSRATAIIGGVLVGGVPIVGAVLFAGALLVGVFVNDSETLVVDLRSPANASELGGTPFNGSDTITEFTSDNIDLTLPDGSTFTTDGVTISLHTDGSDRIEFVSISTRSQPSDDTVDTLRDWSNDLGIATQPPRPASIGSGSTPQSLAAPPSTYICIRRPRGTASRLSQSDSSN